MQPGHGKIFLRSRVRSARVYHIYLDLSLSDGIDGIGALTGHFHHSRSNRQLPFADGASRRPYSDDPERRTRWADRATILQLGMPTTNYTPPTQMHSSCALVVPIIGGYAMRPYPQVPLDVWSGQPMLTG